jgi:hypothetical protein
MANSDPNTTPVKPIAASTTTQRIVISAASIVAVIAAIRGFVPKIIPWNAEHDMLIAGAIITIGTPLLSRLLAKFGWSVSTLTGGA